MPPYARMICHSDPAAHGSREAKSDFRTPVESIGLQKPENLLWVAVEGRPANNATTWPPPSNKTCGRQIRLSKDIRGVPPFLRTPHLVRDTKVRATGGNRRSAGAPSPRGLGISPPAGAGRASCPREVALARRERDAPATADGTPALRVSVPPYASSPRRPTLDSCRAPLRAPALSICPSAWQNKRRRVGLHS
jgi:hypothetical protein